MTELVGVQGALMISATAFVIVIFILIAIALFMYGLGRLVGFLERLGNRIPGAAAKSAVEPLPTPDQPDAGIDGETMAAVTAAIAVVMDGVRFRVVDIQPADNSRSGWVSGSHAATTVSNWSR